MNIDLRLPSEYVEVLQQHVAATGEDINTFVTDIVADSLQAEVESARSRKVRQGTFAEWLQQWCSNGPTDIRDSNKTSISAANQSMRAVLNGAIHRLQDG